MQPAAARRRRANLAAAAPVASAADAPTRPPIEERARSAEPVVAVHGDCARLLPDADRDARRRDARRDRPARASRSPAGDDVRARTRTGAGGQAANVAAWAASLGADARCIAKRGDDAAGRARRARARSARGVELVGPVAAGATGVVVSLVGTDGERSMASDRGVAPTLDAGRARRRVARDCDVLHLSGYALLREPISHAALLAARLARERGARVSVDVAAWTEIRAFGPVRFRELLDAIAPDVLFATEAEWEMLGGAYLTAPTGRDQARRARLRSS